MFEKIMVYCKAHYEKPNYFGFLFGLGYATIFFLWGILMLWYSLEFEYIFERIAIILISYLFVTEGVAWTNIWIGHLFTKKKEVVSDG